MNQKSLLCIVVLSIMLLTANGLKISHKQQTETVDPNSPEAKFIVWIGTNEKINKAFKQNAKLDKVEADEVKDYFTENPDLLDKSVYQGDQDVISCKNSLSAQVKEQFDQEFLDQMNFIEIFSSNSQSPLTEEQIQSIMDDLAIDQKFDGFFTCLNPKIPDSPEENK